MKSTSIGLLACCVLALTACDPYIAAANNALDVSLSPDGQGIQIQFLLCPGRQTDTVELIVKQ